MNQLLTLSFFLLLNLSLFAQDYITSVTRYDQEHGLSHNQINWVFKDSHGMMWVGASNGINRYDGKEFKLVAPMNFYRVLYQFVMEDNDGDLWLKQKKKENNEQELVFFNTITQEVKTFEEKFKNNPIFTSSTYYKSVLLSDGTIVIGTNDGKLIYCDSKYQCDLKIDKPGQKIYPYKKQDSDDLWVYNRSLIPFEEDRSKGWDSEVTYINEVGKIHLSIPFRSNSYIPIGVSNDNKLLYEKNAKHILEIDASGEIDTIIYEQMMDDLNSALVGSKMKYDPINDRFWCNYYRSFFAFERKGGVLPVSSKAYKEFDATEYFNGFIDGDYYWLGTIDGLLKIQLSKAPFKKVFYQSPLSAAQGAFNSCRGMDSDENGNIYVGTKFGLFNLNDPDHILDDKDEYHHATLYDERGYVWTSAKDNLFRINLKTKEVKKYPIPSGGGVYEEIWSFYLDKNNRLWLGMGDDSRLCYLEDGADVIQVFGGGERVDVTRSFTYGFFEDQEDQLWLVCANGLFKFDTKKGIGERFWSSGDSIHYLPSSDLRHAYQDKEGIFWIGSSEGLIRWDRSNNKSRLFTTADGFSHNHIYAVYEDDFGFLWMSSDNGIIQFEKSTHRVKNYLPSDGITHREFNRIAHHQAADGKIYFGGINGVTYFDPKDFVDHFNIQPDIPLVLTDCQLYVGEKEQQESQLSIFREQGKITIAPGDQFLKFDFALLDYENSEHIQYAYTIDDKKEWNIGRESSINLGTLSYGDHLLTIKGKTASGLFSKQKLEIPIQVLKPFYLQYWFIALGFLSLGFSIFLFQKIRTQALINRQKELEETVAERTQTISAQAEELRELDKTKSKFLANISHEFRTPLTLILNTLEEEEVSKIIDHTSIADGRFFGKQEVDIMQRNSRRLETLIEQLLDLSKLEAGKMELQAAPQNIYLYLRNLITSFQPLAQKNEIDLHFYANEEEIELFFDRDKMDKIVYNLLYNAIKFTRKGGSIIIDLQKNREHVFINVKDTGIGIPQEELANIFDRFYQVKKKDEYAYEGTGLGLALVKELAEMHQGRVEVSSEQGFGTSFKLFFPLGSEHLNTNEIQSPIIINNTRIQNTSEITMNEAVLPVATPNETTNPKPILLVIEDNADLRYYQQKRFKDDFQILLAENGEQGLALAFDQIPDVIICDVMMPKKNGYEVCQELKQDERTNHIPVILLTAKAAQEEKIQGLTAGADDYITKPYDQKELQLKVNNLLEQTKKIQERFKVNKEIASIENEATNQDPFVTKITNLLEENLRNQYFGVEQLSEAANLSRSQLFRKLKAITGETPTNFLRTYRLTKAKEILETNKATPSETAYMVGFSTSNYFFKCFKAEFGMTPTEMIEKEKKEENIQ